jgi:hypothetical protein
LLQLLFLRFDCIINISVTITVTVFNIITATLEHAKLHWQQRN